MLPGRPDLRVSETGVCVKRAVGFLVEDAVGRERAHEAPEGVSASAGRLGDGRERRAAVADGVGDLQPGGEIDRARQPEARDHVHDDRLRRQCVMLIHGDFPQDSDARDGGLVDIARLVHGDRGDQSRRSHGGPAKSEQAHTGTGGYFLLGFCFIQSSASAMAVRRSYSVATETASSCNSKIQRSDRLRPLAGDGEIHEAEHRLAGEAFIALEEEMAEERLRRDIALVGGKLRPARRLQRVAVAALAVIVHAGEVELRLVVAVIGGGVAVELTGASRVRLDLLGMPFW